MSKNCRRFCSVSANDDLSNYGNVNQSAVHSDSVRTHPALHVTQSNGSTTAAAAAADIADLDLDFLDLPVDVSPRLKRYPSAKATSIWRHK